jgi:hypothetical protein
MSVQRMLVILAAVGMLTVVPAGTAVARDAEFGTLSCPAGRVVWITERTNAGITTISWNKGIRQLLKSSWSTSLTRTGQRATWWRVTTTGQLDHDVTRAWCGA